MLKKGDRQHGALGDQDRRCRERKCLSTGVNTDCRFIHLQADVPAFRFKGKSFSGMVILMGRRGINDLLDRVNGQVDLPFSVVCRHFRNSFSICVNETDGGLLCNTAKRGSKNKNT